jgi:segregation and condensation protein B
MLCAPKPASPPQSAPPIPDGGDAIAELTRTETFALTAIAYLQPVTRAEISKLAGREISRDVIASLKRRGLIDGAIRAPQPGAPFAYVTTKTFLEAFGFATLRDLPDLERLKAEGLERGQGEDDLDSALGLAEDEDGDAFETASDYFNANSRM